MFLTIGDELDLTDDESLIIKNEDALHLATMKLFEYSL